MVEKFEKAELRHIVIKSVQHGRVLKFDKLSVIHRCRHGLADAGVFTTAPQRRRAVASPGLVYVCILMDGVKIVMDRAKNKDAVEDKSNQFWCVWSAQFGQTVDDWTINEFLGFVTFAEIMEKH